MAIDYLKWDNIDSDSESETGPQLPVTQPADKFSSPKSASIAQDDEGLNIIKRGVNDKKNPEVCEEELVAQLVNEKADKPLPLTFKELQHAWSETITCLKQHPVTQKQYLPATMTTLETLFRAVEGFFSTTTTHAGQLYCAMKTATESRRFKISLLDLQAFIDPLWFGYSVHWSNCRLSCMLVMLFGSPTSFDFIADAYDFFGGLNHRPRLWEEAKTGSSNLGLALMRAKMARLQGHKDAMALLGVELLDTGPYYAGLNPRYQENGDLIPFTHSFIIAVGYEGIRVFQSYSPDVRMPRYTLPQYIERGGAKLRNWDEVSRFVENFKILSTPAVSCYFSA